MAAWHETPSELVERQEDYAQDPHYDHDAYRHFWNRQHGHALDAPYGGHMLGRDSDGVPLYNFEP
jgi:hypothetical protein